MLGPIAAQLEELVLAELNAQHPYAADALAALCAARPSNRAGP